MPRGAPARMKREKKREDEADAGGVRLDVFLDVACIYPTRSQAKEACEGGKVDLNGSAAKPHRTVKPGDTLQVTVPGPAADPRRQGGRRPPRPEGRRPGRSTRRRRPS